MSLITPTARSVTEDTARALDPSVTGTELVALAAHRDAKVRAVIAARADAPMASLISLAHERDDRIHEALVDNPKSPLWVIRKLATDGKSKIRRRAQERLTQLEAV